MKGFKRDNSVLSSFISALELSVDLPKPDQILNATSDFLSLEFNYLF